MQTRRTRRPFVYQPASLPPRQPRQRGQPTLDAALEAKRHRDAFAAQITRLEFQRWR